MNRTRTYTVLLSSLLVFGLPALAAAQTIPAGTDLWATPRDGNTAFTFPAGDVESLCGMPPSSSWNHTVALGGPINSGPAGDTAVTRLNSATFSGGKAVTQVQLAALNMTNLAPQNTPCGPLNWTVGLFGSQPVTTMTLTLDSTSGGTSSSTVGGTFAATLQLSARLDATNATTGSPVGSLFYTVTLPDPGGTAWSLSSTGQFRAGMDTGNNCLETLRSEQNTSAGSGQHAYCIADAISQGNCNLPCLKEN
jgi:hypothetical protein